MAYLAKVVGGFEVPSVLKCERAFVLNEREYRLVRFINSYLSGDGKQPPILSPSFFRPIMPHCGNFTMFPILKSSVEREIGTSFSCGAVGL